MNAERVEEIKTELREISNVMLVMRQERDELRRELRDALHENDDAVNVQAAPAEPMRRRQLG